MRVPREEKTVGRLLLQLQEALAQAKALLTVLKAIGREGVARKADRLILQQRIRFYVLTRHACMGDCRGDGDDYDFGMDDRGRWFCNCPHVRGLCSHLTAAQAVYRAAVTAQPKE